MSILNSTCPWDNANVLQYIDWYGISRFLLHKVALILLFSVSESSTYWQISLTSSIFKCGLQLGFEVVKSLLSGLKTKFKPKIQNKVCKNKLFTRNKSFAVFVSARKKKRGYGRTDGSTDGRTHPLIEPWLTTKNEDKNPKVAPVHDRFVMRFGAVKGRLERNWSLGETSLDCAICLTLLFLEAVLGHLRCSIG